MTTLLALGAGFGIGALVALVVMGLTIIAVLDRFRWAMSLDDADGDEGDGGDDLEVGPHPDRVFMRVERENAPLWPKEPN